MPINKKDYLDEDGNIDAIAYLRAKKQEEAITPIADSVASTTPKQTTTPVTSSYAPATAGVTKTNSYATYTPYLQQNDEQLKNLIAQRSALQAPDYSAYQEAIAKIQKREPFTYNYANDPTYQAMREQYIRNGQLAMKDTLGKASALTGGYGNSYAQWAGQGAYNDYMQRLNDNIPELEQAAYNRYKDQINLDIQNADLLKSLGDLDNARYQREYGALSDAISARNAILSSDYNALNAAMQYETELANQPYMNDLEYDQWKRQQDYASELGMSEYAQKAAQDYDYWKSQQDYSSAQSLKDYEAKQKINAKYSNTTNNPTGNGLLDKTSTEYGRLDTNINNYVKNGNYKGAGDEIASYVRDGYISEEDGLNKYMNALTESVKSGKVDEYTAVNAYIDWVKNKLGYELDDKTESQLREEAERQIWGGDDFAKKSEISTEFVKSAWEKAKKAGVYKRDFDSFMHDYDAGRLSIYKSGKVKLNTGITK